MLLIYFYDQLKLVSKRNKALLGHSIFVLNGAV